MNRDSEKYLERALCDGMKELGGAAYKFVSPGHRGVPDRMCILPCGCIVFIELKSKGKKPSPLQVLEIARIRSLGGVVKVIDNYRQLEDELASMSRHHH